MSSKPVNFCIFRYHLLSLNSKRIQTSFFEEGEITNEEIKERKNEFFALELDGLDNNNKTANPLKLHFKEGNYYIFKIAQKKKTVIYKDFESTVFENEPYVYVIINNDPDIQKIAISFNSDAFTHPGVVKNILKDIFKSDLEKYGLNIEIEQLFDAISFWKHINKHKDAITYINFEYIKPNLARISSALPKDFKNFSENVNSHESHITIKAPQKGILVNIDENNEDIAGLVDYVSKGGGSIKLKIKGYKKTLNTKQNPLTLQIDEVSMEGPANQLIKAFKQIVE